METNSMSRFSWKEIGLVGYLENGCSLHPIPVPTKTQRTQTFWEPLGKTILKETRKV